MEKIINYMEENENLRLKIRLSKQRENEMKIKNIISLS